MTRILRRAGRPHDGEASVFAQAPTPRADPNPRERPQPFTTSGAAETSTLLAAAMRGIPALKAQGLSLEGDLQRARGNSTGARQLYTEAAAIRATPSVKFRLERVQQPGR